MRVAFIIPEKIMKRTLSSLLFVSLILSNAACAQAPAQSRMQRVEQELLPPVLVKGEPGWNIQERMKHYKVPGVSIAVINNFKVEWARAYGVKDIETNESVTTETLFQAGSISKSVAAMVALKKVEQGKIALDANINDRLTSWKLPDNEFTAKHKVTLANLMSHTGGLTVHGFPGYAPGEQIPTLPQVLDGASPANTAAVRVDIEPGTKFRYSGGGVTIAQLAITDIEKKPYPLIAEETVLKPLGMTHSTYSQPLSDAIRKSAASGYRGNGKVVDGKIHIYPEMAAAGLWTTPTDLAKFAIEVQLSLAGQSNKVLSKDTTAKMVTPFIEEFIGMGFFIEKHGKAVYFGHGGADEGFRAQLLVNRDKGYVAVVMVNSDNGQIMDEILRGIAREYQWEDYLPQPQEVVPVDPASLQAYTGRFLVNPDRVLTITSEGGKLYGEPTASPKFELLPVSEDEFIRQDVNVRYKFAKSDGGAVDRIKLTFDSGGSEAPRISSERMVPFELLSSGKFDQALQGYRQVKAEHPDGNAVAEQRLNGLAYGLLEDGNTSLAISVFRINAELYPQSSNVYDSLGEAYMRNGDKDLAIKSYKRSLEINPHNGNAVQMLKKLEH